MQVNDTIASSGQPEAHQFKYIAGAGYQLIINLAMPDSINAIPEEGQIVTAQGMQYVHIPVPFDSPGPDHFLQFLRIMNSHSGHRIWVHCALNYRVSAFLYQYLRITQNLDNEQASHALLPSWQPDPVWKRFMALTREEIGL